MFLKDVEGVKYLDFYGGILTSASATATLRVTEAAIAQQKKLVHVSTLYATVPQLDWRRSWSSSGRMKEKAKVFFTNSGTEANETAVTLAKEATRTPGAGRAAPQLRRAEHARASA